jgi:hypothetical protein
MLFQQFRLSAHAPLENVPHLKREQREEERESERKREKEREKARESERDQCVRW